MNEVIKPLGGEGRQGSFFAIDPENWPDLSPPPTKPKRQRREGYMPKFFGGRLTDPPRAIPPFALQISPPESSESHLVVKEQKEQQEKKRQEVRREGRELMQRFRAGEIPHHVVSDFYHNHATELIPEKQYQIYKDYREMEGLEAIPLGDYARLVVPELFMDDFMSLERQSH